MSVRNAIEIDRGPYSQKIEEIEHCLNLYKFCISCRQEGGGLMGGAVKRDAWHGVQKANGEPQTDYLRG